jgi:hypothetical protein
MAHCQGLAQRLNGVPPVEEIERNALRLEGTRIAGAAAVQPSAMSSSMRR